VTAAILAETKRLGYRPSISFCVFSSLNSSWVSLILFCTLSKHITVFRSPPHAIFDVVIDDFPDYTEGKIKFFICKATMLCQNTFMLCYHVHHTIAFLFDFVSQPVNPVSGFPMEMRNSYDNKCIGINTVDNSIGKPRKYASPKVRFYLHT
jgi:hypothetical protein